MGGATFTVSGKYVQFEVDKATLGVLNYALRGAFNPEDITGGMRTPVFASKLPDHRGLTLTGPLFLVIDEQELVLMREGPGLTMKVQAKDCAQGGLFQMEVERADESKTVFTHTLAPSAFYFDNPNFRNRAGNVLPYKDTTVTMTPRINLPMTCHPALSVETARKWPIGLTIRHAPMCFRGVWTRPPANEPCSTAAACPSGRWPVVDAWAWCLVKTRWKSRRRPRCASSNARPRIGCAGRL